MFLAASPPPQITLTASPKRAVSKDHHHQRGTGDEEIGSTSRLPVAGCGEESPAEQQICLPPGRLSIPVGREDLFRHGLVDRLLRPENGGLAGGILSK